MLPLEQVPLIRFAHRIRRTPKNGTYDAMMGTLQFLITHKLTSLLQHYTTIYILCCFRGVWKNMRFKRESEKEVF